MAAVWPPETEAALAKAVDYQFKAARRKFPWFERESMLSSAWLAAVKAERSYQPNQGATLRTYAEYRIRGQIHDDAMQHWKVTRPLVGLESLVRQPVAPLSNLAKRIELEQLIAKAGLSDDQLQLLELIYVQGHTGASIARRKGSQQSTIPQRLARIFKRIRAVALDTADAHASQSNPTSRSRKRRRSAAARPEERDAGVLKEGPAS